jgi:exportin-2 (importin alpha re-exporter)
MSVFTTLLNFKCPALEVKDEEETEPGPISVVQSEVVECLALLMAKEEEAFQPHLESALSTVWGLLMATGLAPHQDLLVTTSIRFLTTVAASVHHALFASPSVMQNVCEKIIAPNVQLLAHDEELFEDNPFEYIRRDVEGSDTDTRRRVSCDLVRALCRNHESAVTALFSAYIARLLGQAAASAEAWKAKDAAVYLVIALSVKGATARLGATQTNPLVNIAEFFGTSVLPELQAAAGGAAPSSQPVLLADAIKFVTTFRAQLPRETYATLFPLLGGLLAHKAPVVHTYAANAIERMLSVKEADGSHRFGAAQLAPLLQPVLTGLFATLKLSASAENQYVMRAIMRVTAVAAEGMAPYASVCIDELKAILTRVCENPSNPTFPVPSLYLPCTFPVPSLYLPCTFPVPSLYLPCTFPVPSLGARTRQTPPS